MCNTLFRTTYRQFRAYLVKRSFVAECRLCIVLISNLVAGSIEAWASSVWIACCPQHSEMWFRVTPDTNFISSSSRFILGKTRRRLLNFSGSVLIFHFWEHLQFWWNVNGHFARIVTDVKNAMVITVYVHSAIIKSVVYKWHNMGNNTAFNGFKSEHAQFILTLNNIWLRKDSIIIIRVQIIPFLVI